MPLINLLFYVIPIIKKLWKETFSIIRMKIWKFYEILIYLKLSTLSN